MTHVHFVEYARQARDVGGYVVAAGEDPPLAEYRVLIGVTSTLTPQDLNAKTRFVEISFRAAAQLEMDGTAAPTAVAASPHYGAGAVLFRGIGKTGGAKRYAVIQPQA